MWALGDLKPLCQINWRYLAHEFQSYHSLTRICILQDLYVSQFLSPTKKTTTRMYTNEMFVSVDIISKLNAISTKRPKLHH